MFRNAVQPYMVGDIVWSIWKHIVGYSPRKKLTNSFEHKRGEINATLWNSGIEADKKTAQVQKRRLHYISNVYVIKDYANPENDGKTFLYRYGKKIFDKLNDLMNPSFEDEKPVNPFDFWDGANFRLKIRMADGYPSYDKSEFDSPKPLFEDDEKLEEVFKQLHSLSAEIDKKHFKSYEELKAKLYSVLGYTGDASSGAKTAEDEVMEDDDLDMSKMSTPKAKEKAATPSKETKAAEITDDSSDDDEIAYFKSLTR